MSIKSHLMGASVQNISAFYTCLDVLNKRKPTVKSGLSGIIVIVCLVIKTQ